MSAFEPGRAQRPYSVPLRTAQRHRRASCHSQAADAVGRTGCRCSSKHPGKRRQRRRRRSRRPQAPTPVVLAKVSAVLHFPRAPPAHVLRYVTLHLWSQLCTLDSFLAAPRNATRDAANISTKQRQEWQARQSSAAVIADTLMVVPIEMKRRCGRNDVDARVEYFYSNHG